MFEVRIFLETTVKGPKRKTGQYAYVVEYKSKGEPVTRTGTGSVEDTTAHQLSIYALVESLKILTKECEITIYTDSAHIESVINNEWLDAWEEMNWKNKKGEEVKNKELWKKVRSYTQEHMLFVERIKINEYTEWMKSEIRRNEYV